MIGAGRPPPRGAARARRLHRRQPAGGQAAVAATRRDRQPGAGHRRQHGADGAVWDAPAAIRLEGTAGSLSYDLGKPTPVSAFFLQADANDTYKVSGSSDGQDVQPAGAGGEPGRPRPRPAHARDADRADHGPLPAHRRGRRRQRVFDLRVRRLLPRADAVSAGAEDRRGADGGRAEAGGECRPPRRRRRRAARSVRSS